MIKKMFLIVFLAAFAVLPALADKPTLLASDSSDHYHLSTCKIAKKIYEEERLLFAIPEEATASGLVPCKKCSPPTSSSIKD